VTLGGGEQRIASPLGSGSGSAIGRREDRAHEEDRGQGELAARVDGVDVPPKIAASFYRGIEGRSLATASAAIWPLSATIGIPAPGCAEPPAK